MPLRINALKRALFCTGSRMTSNVHDQQACFIREQYQTPVILEIHRVLNSHNLELHLGVAVSSGSLNQF